jgi:crossover junction endodeoxyribonuclease RuvC
MGSDGTVNARVVGIDPGLRITGYACVDASANGSRHVSMVEAGVFRLGKPKGGASVASVSERLEELDTDVRELLARLRPRTVAVEMLFAHYKHPATAIIMGHARGVILLAVRRARMELIEYKPNEIKKALTGYGHASKEQMQAAVQQTLGLPSLPEPPDVADAIAIALTAAWRGAGLERGPRLGASSV